MSKTKGKREAAAGGWQRGGDPFAEDIVPKKQKKKKTGWWGRRPTWQKALMIAGGAVAALALVVAGAWILFVKSPDVSQNNRPGVQDSNPNTPAPDQEVDGPDALTGRKEDFYTFLLLGKDTSSGSTDTIILVSYDVPNQAVNCMSIPRDTMVNVKWDIKRVNSVYSARESSGGGIEGLKKQVGYLTGIVPDFYVVIEWKAVGLLVEELGGVYFDVPYDMNYDDDYQNLHIHQSKGYRLLDGDDAMQVVRWRQNNSGTSYGDTVRIGVQQEFLKAVAQQCLQLKNWTKIGGFARIFFDNVETDLPLNNLLWFAQQAMGADMEKLNFMTLPADYEGSAWSRTYHNYQSYVFPYPDQVVEMVNEFFNPYNREIQESDLQIMYKNRDGSLGVTNATLLDTSVASAPSRPSGGGSSSKPPEDSGNDGDTPDDQPDGAPDGGQPDENTPGGGSTTDPGNTENPGDGSEPPSLENPG